MRERALRLAKQGRSPDSIDWDAIDALGRPMVTFQVNVPGRVRILDVLKRKPRDPERRRLLEKLGVEFGRIYLRYRNAAARAIGRTSGFQIADERERRYCRDAAMHCVLKGVTPTQLLQYWDKRVKQFATPMEYPPLSLLSSGANVDQVACTLAAKAAGRVAHESRRFERSEPTVKPVGGNSFAEVKELDRRLRAALESAGFDTRAYNDRYLIGVQHNAVAIANGKRIFLGEGQAKRMALWAAVNFFNVT